MTMQPRRSQALKKIALYFLLLVPYLLVQYTILTAWPSQSEISREKANLLWIGAYGVFASLLGAAWAWSKGKDGTRRGGVWMRWGFVLMLMLFIGFFIVELR